MNTILNTYIIYIYIYHTYKVNMCNTISIHDVIQCYNNLSQCSILNNDVKLVIQNRSNIIF